MERENLRNFQAKKNRKKATVAKPLMTGERTLYVRAIVASNEIRGRTSPKSACMVEMMIRKMWRAFEDEIT